MWEQTLLYYVDQVGQYYKGMLEQLTPFIAVVLGALFAVWILPFAYWWCRVQFHKATGTEDVQQKYEYMDRYDE
ncbi:hypothetical protein [Eubacterium maltosivorans]|uniref:hypothetical protein n=1 Tax=Eubacterium maltosivorans TaxID=2041044 RepID=UPI0018A04086|nr:hypothetical protein [Eubacterium maltosivorans]